MLDIHSMICAQRVMVLKNYADEENHSSWKITLDYFPSGVGVSSSSTVISIQENFQFTFHPFIKKV